MQGFFNKKIYRSNIFIIILFTLSALYLLYTNLDLNKKNTYIQSYIKSEYLAQFINSDMERLIHGVHEILKGINVTQDHIEDNKEHDEHVDSILRKSLKKYMLSMVMTDKEGNIIHWTREGKKLHIKFREYIRYHLRNKDPNKSLYISEAKKAIPLSDRDKEFFAISKGFYKNGKLDKIIIAYIHLDYLKKKYSKYLKNETLTISYTNGRIFLRIPSNIKCCGKTLEETKEFIKTNKVIENRVITSSVDQKEKLITFIRSTTFPLITSVEVLEDEVLFSWENHKSQIALISIFIIVVSVLLSIYYTKLQKRIDRLTQLDSLTSIYNRGFFTYLAKKEFSKAKRFNQNLPVLMIDIDDFKNINDTYGHQIGDEVIKKLAFTIKKSIRDIDYCGRYGGEEFIVILSNTDINGAEIVASRIATNFKRVKDKDSVISTVSIGISDIKRDDEKIDDIIKRADEAMYLSKKDGKDKITLKL